MINELRVILPEIILLSAASLVLLIDLYLPKQARIITHLLSQFSLILTAVACFYLPAAENLTAFNGQFIADPISNGLKLSMLVLMFLVLLYSRSYTRARDIAFGEFHILALFSTLGMMILVSAKSLLMIYLGLELLSLPLYALVALQRDSQAACEAGMKYFVMGALASGMLLYGISLFYGLAGSIQLSEIANFSHAVQGDNRTIALMAMVFIIAGLAFKLGAAPFHMWIPDVYQGAPTNVTLLVGTAPKVAAFGMAYRLLNDMMPAFNATWGQFFIVMAILSLAIGNIVAIAQTNVKRLLAYSTISHVGFLFLGLLAAPQIGYAPALYYILIYALVTACAFGILLFLSYQTFEAQTFEDLKGLGSRSPWLAFMMLLVAFSLAGVPPTAGFYAKFLILNSLVDINLTWLAAVAVVFSIIGAFYYLKLVRAIYFESPEVPYAVGGKTDFKILLSLNGLAILLLGIFPAPLFTFCQHLFWK